MQNSNIVNTGNEKGRILAIDTGSTSTKLGYYVDGKAIFDTKLVHTAEETGKYRKVMDQDKMRRDAITDLLGKEGIHLDDIDIVMARGGLFAPVITGIYKVNRDMRDVLLTCRDGIHACNLSAVIGDDIAEQVNEYRKDNNLEAPFGSCAAYIADPPMADEMLPECRVGGIPEFPRRAFFHALNSRATVKRYLRDNGHKTNDITAIVAHMGGGITVTLHRNGRVIDTNNGLGGDGPFTPERAGSCPAFALVEMCFSGKYTETEVKKKLLGKGGAVAYFGTNDLGELLERAHEGDKKCETFMNAFSLNIAKYISSEAVTVNGKVDVILLTGGAAYSKEITDAISRRVNFIAPVAIYAGENELNSLAENGYTVLNHTAKIHRYDKNAIVNDEY
ncbi:MAG: butyrate kinase [Bacteroidales bacterium]|nr:butyrate kinase [Bacteroidales bacterium]MCI1786252.1 butyrate kinase [Bacteroidales bacterium]